MKISFWIPTIVLYAVIIAFSNSVQVGTVLFTTTDLVRRCWTENDKSILRARLIMQDLLPDPDCIDFSNPKAAVVLLDYFLACFEIINRFCYGKVQKLMYIALSDALGGYLRAYVLPYAKRGYYAGQIKYYEAEKLFKLYENIKAFLKTNGEGWAVPRKLSRRNFHVSPLVITGGSFEACKQLRIIEKKGKHHCINPHYSFGCPELKNIKFVKNSAGDSPEKNFERFKSSKDTFATKRSLNGDGNRENLKKMKKLNSNTEISSPGHEKLFKNLVEISKNETKEVLKNSKIPEINKNRCRCASHPTNNKNSLKRIIVPLPMLDDSQNPQSIAVPFKNRPFRNLHSASSAFILEYYYMAVIKCFIAAGSTRIDMKNFNIEFHSWLVTQVLPHLNDDKWYPGFGGVLRIVETIKKFGVESGLNEPCFHDTSYLFGKEVAFEVDDGKEGKDQPRNIVEENSSSSKRHVITSILVVSLLWIFLFCACAFYSQATRGRCLFRDRFSETSKKNQSRSRSRSRSQCRFPPPQNSCKSISFQFLVKFFKKNIKNENEQMPRKENEKKVCWYVKQLGNDNLFEKQSLENKNEDKTQTKKNRNSKHIDEPRKAMHGQGDFGFFRHEEYFKPILSYWPSQSCFGKSKIKVVSTGDAKPTQGPEQLDKDTTLLWKKPSIKFNKAGKNEKGNSTSSRTTSISYSASYCASPEDSQNRTIKRDVCTCSSECCHQTSTSCTNRTSQSKVKKILSSTTTECFEDVKAKHKPFMKSVILATTEESECDDEVSTTFESDY